MDYEKTSIIGMIYLQEDFLQRCCENLPDILQVKRLSVSTER